jgi:hypothetical protein
MTRSEVRFGLVGKEHWGYPEWIDQDKAAETRRVMHEKVCVSGQQSGMGEGQSKRDGGPRRQGACIG